MIACQCILHCIAILAIWQNLTLKLEGSGADHFTDDAPLELTVHQLSPRYSLATTDVPQRLQYPILLPLLHLRF